MPFNFSNSCVSQLVHKIPEKLKIGSCELAWSSLWAQGGHGTMPDFIPVLLLGPHIALATGRSLPTLAGRILCWALASTDQSGSPVYLLRPREVPPSSGLAVPLSTFMSLPCHATGHVPQDFLSYKSSWLSHSGGKLEGASLPLRHLSCRGILGAPSAPRTPSVI